MKDPRLTPKVIAALRRQNNIDGKNGVFASIGVDDVDMLLEAAEALLAGPIKANDTDDQMAAISARARGDYKAERRALDRIALRGQEAGR